MDTSSSTLVIITNNNIAIKLKIEKNVQIEILKSKISI